MRDDSNDNSDNNSDDSGTRATSEEKALMFCIVFGTLAFGAAFLKGVVQVFFS